MKIYPEEIDAAHRFQRSQAPPRLSKEQLKAIRGRAGRYAKWTKDHVRLHNLMNVSVFLSLFAFDVLAVLQIPALIGSTAPSLLQFTLAVVLASAAHGFISYSVIVFSMHEGAAHNRIILGQGPFSRGLALLANNACRVFFADPVYYRSRHLPHHQGFGTDQDGAFTNFVHPRRFWMSLLPLAGLFDYNDYKIHTDTQWSRSRRESLLIGLSYIVILGTWTAIRHGIWFPIFVLVIVGPWIAFVLDRLRETTEHNLMALDTPSGARNLGCGGWGMLIGGGPWGQPCHLSHHLIPSLPWYHQCLLHRDLLRLMTAEQRRYFTIRPFFGYPRLLVFVLRENLRYLPLGRS